MAEAGVPNFCSVSAIYFTRYSPIVSFAPGSITLNNKTLNNVEIKRAIKVAIKKVVKASLKE
ncbi:hypothetical protein D3C87_2018540 [compost metagenome]